MSHKHKPNLHALRRSTFERVAPPGEALTIHTDAHGDRLDLSAGGRGMLLVEILPADESQPGLSVEIPEEQVLAFVGAAVRLTGKSPEELRDKYLLAQKRDAP